MRRSDVAAWGLLAVLGLAAPAFAETGEGTDTETDTDTGEPVDGQSASDLANEKGGIQGCSTVGFPVGVGAVVWGIGVVGVRRRGR